MYDLLRNMDPPLGFGNKCPYRQAYRKLIRMNMPLNNHLEVHFSTTLFALIRENLCIKMRSADEMDQMDRELRETISKVWPLQAGKMLDLLVPPVVPLKVRKERAMTVGKLYAGFLLLDAWKARKISGKKPISISALAQGAHPQIQIQTEAQALGKDESGMVRDISNDSNVVEFFPSSQEGGMSEFWDEDGIPRGIPRGG